MDASGYELESVPPHDRLLVIGVGPKRVKVVIGTYGDVTVVAKETAAKSVSAVDVMCSDKISYSTAQVRHSIVQPGIVNVGSQRQAVNSAHCGRRRRCGAGLPW